MTAGLTKTEKIRKILLGLVIAAPVVVIIIALFSGADAVFGKAVSGIFDFKNAAINIYRIVRDLFVAVFLISSGWTIYTRASESRKAKVGIPANAGDKTIIATFLAVLNVLFLVFIAFQAAAFFGGQKFVESQGITYADYARNGFFQLLAVAGIVFVIMVAIYRWTHLREWASRALGIALIIETGVIIVSAVRRLALYIDTYGLTLSRYWAMVVIIVIAAVLTTLLIGALAEIKYEMVIRSVFIGLLVVFPFLLLVNVEDYIVKFNFDRFVNGQTDRFDEPYLSRLGSDAVPALANALRSEWLTSSKVNVLAKSDLYGSLLGDKYGGLQATVEKDWRNAVISDYRALAALGGLKDIKESTLVPEKYVGDISGFTFKSTGITILPNEIDGNLNISYSMRATLKTFPSVVTGDVWTTALSKFVLPIEHIGGTLKLVNGTVNEFVSMPKFIGKDLDLRDVVVNGILPAGIQIGGMVRVSVLTGNVNYERVRAFIKDTQSKGYKVEVPLELMSNPPVVPAPANW